MGLFDFLTRKRAPKHSTVTVKSSAALPDITSGNFYIAYQ